MPSNSLISRLQILTAAALFSTGGAAIKACSLSAWQIAGARSLIAALFIAVVMRRSLRRWSWRTVLVGLAYAATLVLYVQANKSTTAANAIFLQSTAPLYLLFLSPWLLRERIRGRDLLMMLVLALGLALLLTGADDPQQTAPDPLLGNLLGAISGFTWALTVLGLRWLAATENALGAVIAGNLIAGALTAPFWIGSAGSLLGIGGQDLLLLLFLGVFQIGLAYVFVTRGIREVPAFEVSLLILVEPVLNPIWAWIVHGEHPSRGAMAGAALILAATLTKTYVDHRERAAQRS